MEPLIEKALCFLCGGYFYPFNSCLNLPEYCFYKITLSRIKQNSLFMALIKREILTSRKVLYMSFVRVISSRFAKYGFLCLKCQLKPKKKIDTAFFQVSTDEETSGNKVKLSGFQLKTFFNFTLVWLACAQQITTVFTYSQANNQIARTILVILWKLVEPYTIVNVGFIFQSHKLFVKHFFFGRSIWQWNPVPWYDL